MASTPIGPRAAPRSTLAPASRFPPSRWITRRTSKPSQHRSRGSARLPHRSGYDHRIAGRHASSHQQLPGERARASAHSLYLVRIAGVGLPGQTFTMTFYGAYTHWDPGTGPACGQTNTTLTGFNASITVNCFQVLSPTTATANITISPTATASTSDLTLTTSLAGGGTEVENAQFSVVVAQPILSVVDPGSGMQGSQNLWSTSSASTRPLTAPRPSTSVPASRSTGRRRFLGPPSHDPEHQHRSTGHAGRPQRGCDHDRM
jgi:hypothetical protein